MMQSYIMIRYCGKHDHVSVQRTNTTNTNMRFGIVIKTYWMSGILFQKQVLNRLKFSMIVLARSRHRILSFILAYPCIPETHLRTFF